MIFASNQFGPVQLMVGLFARVLTRSSLPNAFIQTLMQEIAGCHSGALILTGLAIPHTNYLSLSSLVPYIKLPGRNPDAQWINTLIHRHRQRCGLIGVSSCGLEREP